MDTSEKYVKMCERAVEIQKEWNPLPGDLVFSNRGGIHALEAATIAMAELTPFGQNKARIKADMVWLPTQDQLQEMVEETQTDCCQAIYHFFRTSKTKTWEQLWLAFVMKEKYGKMWNGNDWVKGASHGPEGD